MVDGFLYPLFFTILLNKLCNYKEAKTRMMLSHKLPFEVLTPPQSAYDWGNSGCDSILRSFISHFNIIIYICSLLLLDYIVLYCVYIIFLLNKTLIHKTSINFVRYYENGNINYCMPKLVSQIVSLCFINANFVNLIASLLP